MTKCSHKTKGEFQLIWLAALAASQQKVEDEQTNGQAIIFIHNRSNALERSVIKYGAINPVLRARNPRPSFLAWFVNTFIIYSVHVEEFLLVSASKYMKRQIQWNSTSCPKTENIQIKINELILGCFEYSTA